jgi:hypothetical protein
MAAISLALPFLLCSPSLLVPSVKNLEFCSIKFSSYSSYLSLSLSLPSILCSPSLLVPSVKNLEFRSIKLFIYSNDLSLSISFLQCFQFIVTCVWLANIVFCYCRPLLTSSATMQRGHLLSSQESRYLLLLIFGP